VSAGDAAAAPRLWDALPEALAGGHDPELPWRLLDGALATALDALPSQEIAIALDPRVALAGDRISIGAGTRIAPGATIHGPARIGRDCRIGPGAVLRGGVWLGDGVGIDAHSVVERTILLDRAAVGPLCRVADSVLGAGSRLGAGTVVASSRDCEAPPKAPRGALLGDGAVTAANATLISGEVIAAGARSAPGAAAGDRSGQGGGP